MATKASGKEYIEHKADILENISKHFNNADMSDVTLKVGDQEFVAHRFLLSTQSKVFMTMLMGENWKDSEEKEITLQESPEAEAVFSDFLQFFYTGKLTLTIDNVCGIHTLADKYDVDVLKDDCVSFMKDVLTGIHGDALLAGLKWLQYAESVLLDNMVALCYSAIRSNFIQFTASKENKHRSFFDELTYEQVKRVLTVPEVGEELVCFGENNVLLAVKKWGSRLYPDIRFYNIDADRVQTKLSAEVDNRKEYYVEANKIQNEMSNIARKAGKRRRLSQDNAKVRCPCDNTSTSQLNICPHINPRLYLSLPYANSVEESSCVNFVEPQDLSDLEGYARRLLFIQDTNIETCKMWKITMSMEYSGDLIYETYTVIPHRSHVGKKFTIAICCMLMEGSKFKKSEYVIRHTGEFRGIMVPVRGPVTTFTFTSPHRFKGSWELNEHHSYHVTILLHK